MSKAKVYLGDGLYADVALEGAIAVTSENGVEVLSEVYFEVDTLTSLIRFARAQGWDVKG